jgi:hypothetical protein
MTNAATSEVKKNLSSCRRQQLLVHHDTTKKISTYGENIKWHIQYNVEITDDGDIIVAEFFYPVTHINQEFL